MSGLMSSQSPSSVMRRRNVRYGASEYRKSVLPKSPSYEDNGRIAHMPRTDQQRAGSRGTCTPRKVRPLDSTWLLIFSRCFSTFVVVDRCWEWTAAEKMDIRLVGSGKVIVVVRGLNVYTGEYEPELGELDIKKL